MGIMKRSNISRNQTQSHPHRAAVAAAAAAAASLAALGGVANAAVPAGSTNVTALPFYDPFGYYGAGSGDLYNQGAWRTTIASSGASGSVNQVQVINANLTYNGLPTSPNGAVDLDPTTVNAANKYEGLKAGIPTVNANDGVSTYYFSMLLKATDLTLIPTSTTATTLANGSASATIGNIIAGFNTDRVANTMTLGDPFLRIRRTGGSTSTSETNWELGVQKDGNVTTSGIVWEPTPHALNDTVMVVGRYVSNSTTTNDDQMDLWVNPDVSKFGLAETNLTTNIAPTISVNAGTGTVDRAIQDFFLRRQADGAHTVIDDVRVSNTWADAAPLTWRGDAAGDTNTWGTSGNWQTGTVPDAAGVRPTFLDIASASKTPNLTVNRTVGGMTFNSATSYTVSADPGVSLTISSSDTMVRPTDAGNRAFANVARFNVVNGGHTISAPITGSATLVVEGNGTLTLSNSSNSYTGGTVIGGGAQNGGGTLAIAADGALGTTSAFPNIFGDGGKLQWLAAFDLSASRTIQILDRGLILDTNGFDTGYGGQILT
jgi:autotransporter-associated beta strand protein